MKRLMAMVLAVAMAVTLFAGCGTKPAGNGTAETAAKAAAAETEKAKPKEPVEIKIPHYKCGQNVGGKFFLPQVERFNKKYEGVYKIVIEELPQDGYLDKIKQLGQQNKLPPLIEGADKDWFEKVIIANQKYYDMTEWLNGKADLKARLIPNSLQYNTKDGKVVAMPLIVTRPVGLFYNSSLYTPAKPVAQMSVDEFEASLGDNKMAFMTAENAWTTSLFLTALVVAEPGGADMLRKYEIPKTSDFNNNIWINAVTKLQKFLQKHASANTLGAAYADAANSFMSKSSAMIPNGPWMVGDFAPEAKDKWSNGFTGEQVKSDIYPGNVAVAGVTGYGWWIPAGLPKDITEGALAFIEFMNSPEEIEAYMLAEGGVAPMMTVSGDYKKKLAENRLLSELSSIVTKDTILINRATDIMPRSVCDVEFGKLLPKLIDGSMTPKQFCEELSRMSEEALKQ